MTGSDAKRRLRKITSGWTEARIREELARFLRGRDEWPRYREFQRAGLKSLRDAVTRHGGARRWAEEMEVPYVEHPPGYRQVWTEERIREELRRYLAGRRAWPARLEFERDGRTALRNAVNRTGGPDRWAAEFGLARHDRLSGIRRGWTNEVVERELKRLIGRRKTWPSRREFEEAGLYSMLISIYRHEGTRYWAKRLGVSPPAGRGKPRSAVWTNERIRAELERFCAERNDWPTEREFVEAGERTLYGAASRNGGVAYWARELDLRRRGRQA